MRTPLLTLLLMGSAAFAVQAQVHDTSRVAGSAMPDMPGMTMGADGADTASPVDAGIHAAMSQAMTGMSLHMTMTPPRAPAPGDSARAQHIVTVLRASIAKYRDVNAALADGFKPFLPNVPQDVYHFTKRGNGIKAAFTFDPARPTSLLYTKTPSGYVLVGAMYTAPFRATPADLDARVPLSIYPWHLHTNLCIPPRDQPGLWRERRDGKPLFGPKGSITTKAACDAAGGTFRPHLFGWMVHVMTNDQAGVRDAD